MRIGADCRGAALVEFAIVVTLLLALVFGIIEFGLIMKDHLTLGQAAREGARSAALGSPTSTVQTRIRDSAPTLDESRIQVTLQKRDVSGGSGGWTALGDASTGSQNDAISGNQIRVSVAYPHRLITGSLFSWIFGSGSTVTIQGEMVYRRE